MFKILKTFKVASDIPIISDNYVVFHFDEYPILFSGTNKYNVKIIGSLAYEDSNTDLFRYFNIVVSNKQYFEFIKGKKSYLDLINELGSVFILDKDINGKLINTFQIPTSKIPSAYLPLSTSFCPNVEKVLGKEFSFKLKGLFADMNEALSNQVAVISKAADKIFSNALDSINAPFVQKEIHQFAFSEGSFRFNFRIKNFSSNVFFKDEPFYKFINEYLDYSFNELVNEASTIVGENFDETKFKNNLEKSLNDLYVSLSQDFTDESKKKLLKNVLDTAGEIETMTEQIGNGFTNFELVAYDTNKTESVISHVDSDFLPKISAASEVIITNSKDITEDNDFTEYSIQIFELNTTTRRGHAQIYNFLKEERMDKPKIRIEGSEALAGTKFTQSLHLDEWIKVKAKAKKSKDKFKFLTINFD